MNQILLILHLFGFGGGVAAALGNFLVTAQVEANPADAAALSRLRMPFTRAGQGAIGLLWLTGIILLWSKWGGPASVPSLFWVKLLLVVALTAVIGAMDVTMKAVRGGNVALAARLPILGRVGAALLVLIVIVAVFAFD